MMPVILMGLAGAKRWGDYSYVRVASENHLFWGEFTLQTSCLKEKTYHLLDISLHSAKGYSRHKTKVKVKNNFIEPSPLLINYTKEIRICQNRRPPFLADVICT